MEAAYKDMKMLVESVVMCGAEVWGCCRQLGETEQVQLRAMRIFLGVGRLHPSVATGGNGSVTIGVGSKTEVCGILV